MFAFVILDTHSMEIFGARDRFGIKPFYYYHDNDVFIFASQTETEGMIVPEAMSSGLPVLAVKDKVFEQFIESGKSGFLVEKDMDVFNDQLDKLFKDEDLRSTIGKNARQKIEQFSLDEIAKKFEKLYKQLA